MGLKEWISQLIKRLLSSYVEGIAESNLQGSLNRAVGKVDIHHVRLQQALLEAQHLQLLSSDVSVCAQIPWRNLASEHAVITVSDVWIEVCAKAQDQEQALKSWRARRAREVQARVETGLQEAKQKEQGGDAGGGWGRAVSKRVAHALVARLQVHVERLHVRAWLENSPPVDIRCERLALDDMAIEGRPSQLLSCPTPPEASTYTASLHKGLELEGLSINLALAPSPESALPKLHELRLLLMAAQKRVESAPTYATHRREELLDIKGELQSESTVHGRDDVVPSERVVGPISLESWLWHSTDAGLLWLRAELSTKEDVPMLSISPAISAWARRATDWYLAANAPPASLRAGVEAALAERYSGRGGSSPSKGGSSPSKVRSSLESEYAALLSFKSRKEDYDAVRLSEIEDVAPLDVLVRVQLQFQMPAPADRMALTEAESNEPAPREEAADAPSNSNQAEDPAPKSTAAPTNARWFGGVPGNAVAQVRRWLPGGGSAEDARFEDAEDDASDVISDATRKGVLPEELEEPRRVELMLEIPDCIVFCLRPSVSSTGKAFSVHSGLECQAAVKTTGPSFELSSYLHSPWEANLNTDVTSLAIHLGDSQSDEQLLFAQSEGAMSFANPEGEFLTPRSTVVSTMSLERQTAVIQFTMACTHKGGVAAAASQSGARWSLFMRVKEEPFQLSLSPWSLRSVAELLAAVVRSASGDTATDSAAPEGTEEAPMDARLSDILTPLPSEREAEAQASNDEDMDLDIDFNANFEAPVLRWSVPNGNVTLALGSFLLRTCGSPPPAERLPALERCSWQRFACYCQLANTSIAVKAQENETWIYEPSTICVRAWRQFEPNMESASARQPRNWQVLLESELLRWTIYPSVLEVVGQILPSVKYSLQPLVHVLVGFMGKSPSSPGAPEADESSKGKDEGDSPRRRFSSGGTSRKSSEVEQLSLNEQLSAQVKGPVKLSVCVRLQRCELMVQPVGGPGDSLASAPSSVLIEDMQATYLARADRSDFFAQQARIEVSYGGVPLLTCTKGGTLTVQSSGSCLAVSLQSSLFALDWQQQQAHRIMLVAVEMSGNYTRGQMQAEECLAESHKDSESPAVRSLDEDLTIVQQHVGQKLWEEVKKIRRPTITPRQRRVSSDFVGFDLISGRTSLVSCLGDSATGTAMPLEQRHSGASQSSASVTSRKSHVGRENSSHNKTEKLGLPEVTGDCFMEVIFRCDGIRASFMECEPATVASFLEQSPNSPNTPTTVLQCTLAGINSSLQVFHTGDTSTRISLSSTEMVLRRRQIMLPRKEGKLLHVEAVRLAAQQESTVLASWAQVCVLYRQCDYDFIQDFIRQSVVSTFRDVAAFARTQSPSGTDPQQDAPDSQQASVTEEAPRKQFKRRFHLDIGAPRLFVPTDRTTHCTAGPSALYGRQLLPDVASGEPWLPARPGEGFLLFDFGQIAVQSMGEDGKAGEINLMLRGAHVLGADPQNVEKPLEMLRPVLWNVVLRTGDGIEFHARDETMAGRLSMTRAQLTLLLDVLAENIGYGGRAALRATVSNSSCADDEMPAAVNTHAAPRSSAASTGSRRSRASSIDQKMNGFKFSWTWPGELDLDVLFTEAAPLVRFRMESGRFLIHNTIKKSQYILECGALSMLDLREGSKNANRRLLECGKPADGGPCFKLLTELPAGEDGRNTLTFSQPVLLLLPQLLTDSLTWGVSSWQQCTFCGDPAKPQQPVANEPLTHVDIVFDEGAVRIAEKWSEPTEYLEITGSLRLKVVISSQGIRYEQYSCKGGSMRLRSGLRCATSTITPNLEWEMAGEQVGKVNPELNMRHTQLRLTKVVMHPIDVRMSTRDQRALGAAIAELGTFDAGTAEPEEELKIRDPLAALFQNSFTLSLDSITLEGAQVHILDQAGSTVLPGLLARARCRHLRGEIQNRPGDAPMVNLETPGLDFDLWAHHPRRGVWDPVIPECHWELKHHTERVDQGGPWEIRVQNVAKACGPVSVLLSPSCVHLVARIFRARDFDMRFDNLLLGVNISGLDCYVESEGGGRCLLGAEARLQPLDELLAGVDTSRFWQLAVTLANSHAGASKCVVPMDQEVCIPWDLGAEGLLVCRVVMLHPPHRILMVSSTFCLYNHCSIDLDVRFLQPDVDAGTASVPLHPAPAFRSIHAGFLEADESQFGAGGGETGRRPLPVPESAAGPPAGSGPEGELRLRAGWILAAPAPACTTTVAGSCDAYFQVRPSLEATNTECYGWSEVLQPWDAENGVTVSSSQTSVPICALGSFIGPSFQPKTSSSSNLSLARAEEPQQAASASTSRHWLHLQAGTSGALASGSFCSIKIQAPLTVMNACPCEVLCWVNPVVTHSYLGVKVEKCSGDLVVLDGRGSEFRVPLCGEVEISPLQLDSKGYFYWTSDGQRHRTKPKWPNTNCVIAEFGADHYVNWRCVEVLVVEKAASPVKIAAQGELPMFGVLCEQATISFALNSRGERTGWSLPARVGSGPPIGGHTSGMESVSRPAQEVIDLPHTQVPVRLIMHRRGGGRELVINAFCWFVNCTGLDVRLMQPSLSYGRGAMCPVPFFGERVAFLPTVRNEAGDLVANLCMNGSIVTERVPDIGGSVQVDLSLMHQCCLRTEVITLYKGLGDVPCRLVSLIPQILLFNKAGFEIGFRQAYSGLRASIVWVAPGKSGTFWWAVETPPRRVEVIARLPEGQTVWSPSFEIVKTMIGAYPFVLSDGKGGRCLLCVRIDQDATVFSVTVCDSSACHMLTNHHPGLTLRVMPDQLDSKDRTDESLYHFSVPCGKQVPFAGARPFQPKRRIRLILRSTADPQEVAELVVDLDRTSTISFLPAAARKSRGPYAGRWTTFGETIASNILKGSFNKDRSAAGGLPQSGGIRALSSTLRVPVSLTVELCERVAIVTASSTVLSVEEARQHTHNKLSFKSLSVALISEETRRPTRRPSAILNAHHGESRPSTPLNGQFGGIPRVEAFTVHLKGVTLETVLTPNRMRDVDFEVEYVQLSMRHPHEDIVLANVTKPFIKTHHRHDDVAMLDIHVSDAQVSLGQMEVTITEDVWVQAARLARDLMPDSPGLSLETVLTRAGKPFHYSCLDPFHATSKLVLRRLEVSKIQVQIWCRIYLGSRYVPNWVRAAVQLVSWGTSTLDVKGASVKVNSQSLFLQDQPGVGSPAAVFAQVSSHYLPYLAARWRALLKDSNVFLGGFLSRFRWNPRQRSENTLWASISIIHKNGEVRIRPPVKPQARAEIART